MQKLLSASIGSFLLATNIAVAATSPINLSPFPGEKKVAVDNTKAFTGTCGDAVVRVLDVQSVEQGYYQGDPDSQIIVRADSGRKTLRLGNENGLSDLTGLACVPTKTGKRLLVWTRCNGNNAACESFQFIVIDPDHAALVAPRDPMKDTCDEKCASQLIGNQLPQQINKN